jgi:hypothetical protein
MMKRMLGFLSADCAVAIRNTSAFGENNRPVECTEVHIAKKSQLLKAARDRRR